MKTDKVNSTAKSLKNLMGIILISSLFLCAGCRGKEPDPGEIPSNIPIINGIYLRDEAGLSMGIKGNSKPNVRHGTHANYVDSDYFIVFFPNPLINYGNLLLKSPDPDELKKVWIVPARYRPDFEPPGEEAVEFDKFNGNDILFHQSDIFGNWLEMNLTELPSGYYRVYVESGGFIMYDNIVIDKNFNPSGR